MTDTAPEAEEAESPKETGSHEEQYEIQQNTEQATLEGDPEPEVESVEAAPEAEAAPVEEAAPPEE
jgi:hypothetical protein